MQRRRRRARPARPCTPAAKDQEKNGHREVSVEVSSGDTWWTGDDNCPFAAGASQEFLNQVRQSMPPCDDGFTISSGVAHGIGCIPEELSGRGDIQAVQLRSRGPACGQRPADRLGAGIMGPMEIVLWITAASLMALGVVGTVLPALPGTALVLAGIVLGAWIDDFERVSAWTVGIVAVLAVISWVLDYVAGLLGAKRMGASRQAVIGAALGTVVGLLMGIVGILFMPLVGAAVGEYLARRDELRAVKVGVATWMGVMVGLIAKVVLAFVMIGAFGLALLVP